MLYAFFQKLPVILSTTLKFNNKIRNKMIYFPSDRFLNYEIIIKKYIHVIIPIDFKIRTGKKYCLLRTKSLSYNKAKKMYSQLFFSFKCTFKYFNELPSL